MGEIIGGSGRLTYDLGWYSNCLVDDDDPQYIVTYEEIGGRRAKLVRPRAEGDGLITGVYFEDFDGSNLDIPSQNRLQISGMGLTPDQQETALALFRTIRPLASESQGKLEPSGDQRTVTSIDDIDPNECNWIHNITACNDTLVIGPYEEDAIEPDFGEDGLSYLVPDRDVVCGPDQGVAITSDGQVSCLEPADPQPGDNGQVMVSPGKPPVVEPAQ